MNIPFVEESAALLERTPKVLDALLRGLPPEWVRATDGPGTWSAYDVVGHLNHGERTDWMVRARIILEHGQSRTFEPFDMEAQFSESGNKSMDDLLDEFSTLRASNLQALGDLRLTEQGMHPALGAVTLRQLLATWTAHDLAHILQISRTMARRYREEVGPWAQYLSVMR
jgi:hypothetical protein